MKKIKGYFVDFLVFLLRKMGVGCIIGVRIDGGIISNLRQTTYWYENQLNDVKTFDSYGTEYEIPYGRPFHIETKKPIIEIQLIENNVEK